MRQSLNEAAARGEEAALVEEGKRLGLASRAGAMTGNQALTVSLFLLYAGPMVVAAQLGDDLDVAFWISRLGSLALLLPFAFITVHIVHVSYMYSHRYPKWLLYVGFVAPAIFLCLAGGYYLSEASYLSSNLGSLDCGAGTEIPEKRMLQKAYMQAANVYERCTKRLLAENGNVALPRRPLLQNCEEFALDGKDAALTEGGPKYYVMVGYQVLGQPHSNLPAAKKALAKGQWQGQTPARMIIEVEDGVVQSIPYAVGGVNTARSDTSKMIEALKQHLKDEPLAEKVFVMGEDKYLFDYLASLEANYNCGGFCKPGERLWTPVQNGEAEGEGACAPYVALKFQTIHRQATLLFFISGITGSIALIGLAAADPLLGRLGYK